MNRLWQALTVSAAIIRADIAEIDRYDLFAEQFRRGRQGSAISEREVRDAYLQWRLVSVRAELAKPGLLRAIGYLLAEREGNCWPLPLLS